MVPHIKTSPWKSSQISESQPGDLGSGFSWAPSLCLWHSLGLRTQSLHEACEQCLEKASGIEKILWCESTLFPIDGSASFYQDATFVFELKKVFNDGESWIKIPLEKFYGSIYLFGYA